MKYLPRPCAEFPNDNPGLHDGAVWVCAWSRARPRAVVRASGVARRQGLGEYPPCSSPLHAVEAAAVGPEALTELAPVVSEERSGSSQASPVLRMHAWSPQPPLVVEAGAVASSEADPFVDELEALIEDWDQTPTPGGEQLSGRAPGDPSTAMPGQALPMVHAGRAVEPPSTEDPFELELLNEILDPVGSGLSKAAPPAPVVQPLEPLALELTPLPPSSSAWFDFTSRLSAWLLQGGATRAAALLSSLLEGNQVSLQRLSRPARERLLAQGMAQVSEADVVPTAELLDRARRFQHDFLCRSVDESAAVDWLSRLLSGLLAAELDEKDVREALRQCGALGLLTRAA